jgi:DNA repair and recombination RAD54-like protein
MLTSLGYEGAGECSIGSHISGPVWDLIPGAREGMFPHQREAFEFMWTKLAGGIDIEQVKKNVKTDTLSGCVVSHAPGTGKTRLAITFVQSYLELFPHCRPMIIAPKVMLATWEQEFRKWNVKVPFHVLNFTDIHWNGDKTIENKAANDEEFAEKLSMNNFNSSYRRLLKLQSWVEGSSVIGMSYSLFTRLAKGQGKIGDVSQLLLERPGLLILDEGHTPRNNESHIWKLLVKVRTEKRIILSGTPFQNNFEELYNILCLLRGKHYVDSKLPGKDEGKGFWTSLTLNNITAERFNEIRSKLDPFVHIYNGEILQKSLPGLRESVVILNPLPRQKEMIAMMEKSETNGNLDLEYKVSLASIHPSLATRMKKLSDEVTSSLDKPSLERLRLNPCEGVKARFVYEIVRRCHKTERVLVFSQYLEPLDLIMEQLSTKFPWTKDKEILQMSGQVTTETRQSLMKAFNDMKSDAKVMLATTKACGEGIQLIGASRVVLLDVVWNPSVGRQAIGRAYRIGQEKIVYTYNLIAEGSQEKSKYDIQAQKDHMSKKLFSSKSQPSQCNQSPEVIIKDSILEGMTEDENLKEMFVNILPSQ